MKNLFIVFILGVLVFYVTEKYDLLGRSCEVDKIQHKVEKIYANLGQYQDGRIASNKVEKEIRRGTVKVDKKEIALKMSIESNVRKRRECNVPNTLMLQNLR